MIADFAMGNTSPLRRAMLADDLAGAREILDEQGEGSPDIINEDFTSDCLYNPIMSTQSPLHTAIARDKTEMACLLMRYGGDVNAPGLWQQSCLHLAARRNNAALCRHVMEYGGDLYAEDDTGKRPIHASVMSVVGRDTNNVDALKYLLEEIGKPEDIALTDDNGNTPLHCAAWFGNCAAVEYLLGKNADPAAENAFGRTPIEEAQESNKRDTHGILYEWSNVTRAVDPEDIEAAAAEGE